MGGNYQSYFPPKRRLRWIVLGLGFAVCLLVFYCLTRNAATSADQEPIDAVVDGPHRRENIYRRNFIKTMMRHAWSNYAAFAWGDNELRPMSQSGFGGEAPFGGAKLGLTIVDSLDTLFLMGLHAELDNATNWIRNNFNINKASTMSVFEANIRLLGGFLSIHALTRNKVYMKKAIDVANALMPAFDSSSKLPYSLLNVNSGVGSLFSWMPGDCIVLSEAGTLHLEFAYLSEITGNPVYLSKVNKVRSILKQTKSIEGLYPNQVDFYNGNGSKCRNGVSTSIGALGDSFYEYLLKAWLLSGKRDHEAKDMFYSAVQALETHLLQTSASGLKYFATMGQGNNLAHEMEHLACFFGGLLSMAAGESSDPAHFLRLAQDVTLTCRKSYTATVTKLGPEKFIFDEDGNPTPRTGGDRQYSLRPEVVESYYYLWKATGDEKYRDWAWDAAQAMERYCRKQNGYTGIRDVDQRNPVSDNVQQSFFLAETLKYLYLIFLDSDPVPLDAWVFNTEAHPLPVIGSPSFKEAFYSWRGVAFSDPISDS